MSRVTQFVSGLRFLKRLVLTSEASVPTASQLLSVVLGLGFKTHTLANFQKISLY